MEFWHDILTEKSWKILKDIKDKFNFVLIGGWAIYLWTRALKSRDIDLIVDFKVLNNLKKNFDLKKNDNLKKYEIKKEEIDIDIYVPYYSKLILPVEDLIKYAQDIEGFKVLNKEALLILKQGAEKEREFSEKGLKDRIDIIMLLFMTNFDFKEYYSLIEKYNLKDYPLRLRMILNNFKELKYLNLNPREYKLKKSKIIDDLRYQKAYK